VQKVKVIDRSVQKLECKKGWTDGQTDERRRLHYLPC